MCESQTFEIGGGNGFLRKFQQTKDVGSLCRMDYRASYVQIIVRGGALRKPEAERNVWSVPY